MRKLTLTVKASNKERSKEKVEFAIIYFADRGFKVFATNIFDKKMLTNLEHYPTLLGIMQNQDPSGLTAMKVSDDKYLYTFVLNLKNPEAKDTRLQKQTMTVVNFLINRKISQKLLLFYDEFERFLEDYFYPIVFLDDLYAIDFTNVILKFMEIVDKEIEEQAIKIEIDKEQVRSKRKDPEFSLAVEFNKWIEENRLED